MDATVIQCTICSSKMKLPSSHFGKKLKCPKCEAVLVTTAEGKLAKAISAEQAQAAKQKQQQQGGGGQAKAAPAKAPQPQKPAQAKQPQAKPATQKTAQAKPAAQGTKATAKTATAEKKTEATKPSAKKGEAKPSGKSAGKGQLKMAKSAAPKKKVAGVRANKEKLGAIKRPSVKDRVEALDHEKDTTRIIGLIATVGLILSVAGTVAWFVFFSGSEEERTDPFDNVVLAEEPELSESRTFDMQINGSIEEVQVYERNTDGMEFVRIPAGTYTIGGGKRSDERPEVEVTVPEFYIGHDEVTANQFRQFTRHLQNMSRQHSLARTEIEAWERRAPRYAKRLEALMIQNDTTVYNHPFDRNASTPSNFGNDDEAAHNISWFDAFRYQLWANGMRPQYGILPTEVDWEVAARGPQGTIYPWGNTVQELHDQTADDRRVGEMRPEDRAEYILETYGLISDIPEAGVLPSDAPSTPRNDFGVRNIFGNAAEYTWDRYAEGLYEYVRDINEPEHRAFGATGGADTLLAYDSENNRRTLRASSIGIERNQLTESRFTRRVDPDPTGPSNDLVHRRSVGFRAVFYPDGTAPYGDELQPLIDLYEFRKQMPDWEATDSEGELIWSPEEEREQRAEFEEEIKDRLRLWYSALD